MAGKYTARQATRDYVRDLVRELRVAPSPMWAGTTWADYQAATRAKIAELYRGRHVAHVDRYGIPHAQDA